MSEKSLLKDVNRRHLYAILAANVLFYIFVAEHDEIGRSDWQALVKQTVEFLPNTLVVALLTIFNGLIPPDAKAMIVFGRLHYPLPSARAFSHWIDRDPNIDRQRLVRKLGVLPAQPADQSSAWYALSLQNSRFRASSAHESRSVSVLSRSWVLLLLFGVISFIAATFQFKSGQRLDAVFRHLAFRTWLIRFCSEELRKSHGHDGTRVGKRSGSGDVDGRLFRN